MVPFTVTRQWKCSTAARLPYSTVCGQTPLQFRSSTSQILWQLAVQFCCKAHLTKR